MSRRLGALVLIAIVITGILSFGGDPSFGSRGTAVQRS